jgi:predicted nuclease of predicted toxin-antitoxin system
VTLRFLVDECLTPDLAAIALACGFEAHHLVQLGLAGLPDREIVRYLAGRNLVLVTNNARDFLALFRRVDVHGGLVVVRPSVPARAQVRLFGSVLDAIDGMPDLVNRLVAVDRVGAVSVRDWPAVA